MKNKLNKIISLSIILILLLLLNYFRYTEATYKSYDKGTGRWYRDNWTGVDWFAGYTSTKIDKWPIGYDKPYELSANGKQRYQRILTTTKILTFAWYVLVVVDVAALLYIINKKEGRDKSVSY